MVAVIQDPDVARKILKAMGLPHEPPETAPARLHGARPPPAEDAVDFVQDGDLNFSPPEGDVDVA